MIRKLIRALRRQPAPIYAPSTESVRRFEELSRNNHRLRRYFEKKADQLFR